MNISYCYKIDHIPDFTLNKYSNANDIGSVSDKNLIFIKQLHGLGREYGIDFHLYYIFNPEVKLGCRMSIVMECCFRDRSDGKYPDIPDEDTLFDIISSFAVFDIYKLQKALPPCEYDSHHSYKYFSYMQKHEIYTAPRYGTVSDVNKDKCYYSVSKWDIRSDARFFNTLSLMGRLNRHIVLRVDAVCTDDSEKIIREINDKGIYSGLKDSSSFSLMKDSGHDEAAGSIASYYEKYMESMRTQLQFYAAVCVLSDCKSDCDLILDTMAAEIIESGQTDKLPKENLDGDFSCGYMKEALKSFVKEELFARRDLNSIKKVSCMPVLYTADELSAFFSFPYLERGERLDMRKETDPAICEYNGPLLRLGVISDDDNAGKSIMEVNIPLDNLNKHGYICGVPGSGKTYTMKHIIHTLNREKIPFLVFEPAKKEYRELFLIDAERKLSSAGAFEEKDRTDNIILFSPCANSFFPFHINPLQIPVGVNVSEYIAMLVNVFKGSFFWPTPSDMVLQRALENTYRMKHLLGNRIIKESDKDFPTMSDLYEGYKRAIDELSYASEIVSNLTGIMESRLGTLTSGLPGEIFNIGYSSIKPEEWISKSVIMELEMLTPEQANFISLLILSLVRLQLKKNKVSGGRLRHVIFFEEAHNLIGPTAEEATEENVSAKLAATILIKNMLAEVRAYNEGIIIADQLPTALAPEVLKNTSLKIAHRQLSADERSAIAQVMSADSLQTEKLAQFTKGRALCIYEDESLFKPFDMQVTSHFKYKGDTTSDEEVLERVIDSDWYLQIYSNSFSARYERLLMLYDKCNNYLDSAIEEKDLYSPEAYIDRLFKLDNEVDVIKDMFMGINFSFHTIEASLNYPNGMAYNYFYIENMEKLTDIFEKIKELSRRIRESAEKAAGSIQ